MTDRQTDRQTDKQTKNRQTEKWADINTNNSLRRYKGTN